MKNIAVVKAGTDELVAYISEDTCINNKDYELIDYGDNEPVFTNTNGVLCIKPNTFITKL